MKPFKQKLVIVTTVPITIKSILKNQPKFLDRSFDVCIITSSGKEIDDIERNEGVKTYTVEMQRAISPLKDLISVFKLFILFLKIRPDIVHSYTPKAGLLSMLASSFAFVRIRIHTFTGLIFPSRRGFTKLILIYMDRLTIFLSSCVIAESEGVKDELESIKAPLTKIKKIGYGNISGVDEQLFSPVSIDKKILLKTSFGIPQEAFTFCYVGRINYEKGISEMIDAFIRLKENPYLIIAGNFDGEYPISKKHQKLIILHPRIIHLGFVDDVKKVYGASDISVLVSYREGFPNTILESCSMGVPCIASNVNGSREIIKTNKTGWLIPIMDKENTFIAMNTSMQSLEKLKIIGMNCRELIMEKFTKRKYLKELISFYQNLDEYI